MIYSRLVAVFHCFNHHYNVVYIPIGFIFVRTFVVTTTVIKRGNVITRGSSVISKSSFSVVLGYRPISLHLQLDWCATFSVVTLHSVFVQCVACKFQFIEGKF